MASENPFSVEHAKSGRSHCKQTREAIPKGAIRIGREVPGRDEDAPPMTFWYSLPGFTNMLAKARKVSVNVG